MMRIRKSSERGRTRLDWLDSFHSFSFGNYVDPQHMSFGVLRVINDDRIAPGKGFAPHSHRDMEIITYVLEGALEHKDSLGNSSVIRAGEVQRMSAGTGITHSEFNPSDQEQVHLLQIWIESKFKGLPPSYEQRSFGFEESPSRLRVVVSPDGRDGSLTIHQDAIVLAGRVSPDSGLRYEIAPGRRVYVHLARGSAILNGNPLDAGDGIAVTDESGLLLESGNNAEVLVFDLP
ncbi:pirin family protein [Methylocaldum sp.]|uniref:pirin family protein n=1 Tax=Methylocaldum sp. TaxID=1969727 RepID=UPI002D75B071|nr:pirin family protein [Methylocaldum sp.]HYE34775.1 pirin family protein [Methylocaldum sp.]